MNWQNEAKLYSDSVKKQEGIFFWLAISIIVIGYCSGCSGKKVIMQDKEPYIEIDYDEETGQEKARS